MRITVTRAAVNVLWLVGLGVLLSYAIAGSDYYGTRLIERPRHPAYWSLKPGGSTGHALGIAGSLMMILLLAYSLRRRWRPMRKLGRISAWLEVHIWLGVVGPLLVVLHTSFKVRGLAALSFWSMIVVMLSGVLGRYLYLQIPRTRSGDEMSLRELQQREAELATRLRRAVGAADETLARLEALAPAVPRTGGARAIVGALVDDLRLPFRIRAALRDAEIPRRLRREIARTLRGQWLLRRRLALLNATHRLFQYWHVAHKPFAVVMYLFMLIHIVVVLVTGYALGGRS